MEEPYEYNVEWKRPSKKEHMDSIYMKFKNRQN